MLEVAGARLTTRVAAILSLLFGLWASAAAVTPFFPSAVPAGVCGLALGFVALRAERVPGWRRTAWFGLAFNALAIAIVFVIFIALAV
jgi:putative effector of murein hydrolase LrgA (UPF0299 family)